MTTTAAAWRHVEDMYGACFHLLHESPEGWTNVPCGCITPTPDPTSPCGFAECPYQTGARYWHAQAAPLPVPTSIHHPHQPTRCTCGHALEAVR